MKRVAAALALGALVTATGCARVFHSYDVAPNGLARTENQWRTMLAGGRGDSVATRINRGGSEVPGDELLRLLYLGTAAHYGRDFEHSNQYLEAAAALSDDRVTKSVSRSMLSLISNDGVLPYTPSHSERLLIPYYAALNYIELGRMEDAAVEARRLSALLQSDADSKADISDDVRQLRAAMRSFTAAVFEATGNRNDALVAYRNAAALGAAVDTSFLTASNAADTTGTVVVLLENGFVAHRVEENLFVWLGPDEMYAFSTGGPSENRARTASSVATRVVSNALTPDRNDWRRRRGGENIYVPLPEELRQSHHVRQQCESQPGSIADARENGRNAADPARRNDTTAAPASTSAAASAPPRRARTCDDDDDVPYLLKVAWPVYSGEGAPSSAFVITGSDTARTTFADLSGAVVNDYSSQLPLIVARTIARGAAKAALTQSAKKRAAQKSEGLGKLVGLLGNAGNVLLERADTRSWHLLPGGVAVVRLKLPAGAHNLSASLPGSGPVDLGTVNVEAGKISFLTHRAY